MRNDPMTMALLLDEYGALLTDKQRECCELYFNQDFSLAEIAEELGISRQGVHDSISRAEASLQQMEDALGNVRREQEIRRAAAEIEQSALTLTASSDEQVRVLAARIEAAVRKLL